MAFVIAALLVISVSLFSGACFATRPLTTAKIATMASPEEVPEQLVNDLCSKTKDPSFCHNFAKGDTQTFLTMHEEVRKKVLDTAIEITSASKDEFSQALNKKELNPQDKPAIESCIALYNKVEASLRNSAATANLKAVELELQVAGESLWQCEVSLHANPSDSRMALLWETNGLANSFVSYVQSEFYAHTLVKH